MAAATTVGLISAGLAAAGTVYQAKQAGDARKEAKKQADIEASRLAEQEKKALKQRRQVVDRQRKQLFGGSGKSYDINPTGGLGIPTSNSGGLLG
jgi:hypothetical protein